MMNKENSVLTRSVIRNAAWNVFFILGLYILLNAFLLIILEYESARILDNHLDHETEHFMNAMHMEGDSLIIDNPKELSESDLVNISPTSFFLQVYKPTGDLLLQSKNLSDFDHIPIVLPETMGAHSYSTLRLKDHSLRVLYTTLRDETGTALAIMQLAAQKISLSEFMPNLVTYNVISFPIIIFLIVVGSLLLSKKSFNPINKIIDLANGISANKLNKRLDYKAGPDDELGRLRDTLNNLFDRLQKQIEQISQFTDNASHQLMSPLTVLKSELEYIMRKNHENSECLESFSIMAEQTDRMIKIVRTLLILAKECDPCYSERSVFNLSNLILDIEKMYSKKNISVDIDGGIYIRGNKEYFMMAMHNLIDNAFKYSDDHKPVTITAKFDKRKVNVSVCDYGDGIPENQRQKIFERFYRYDDGHKGRPSGFGLGLALVKAIIISMNGSIIIHDNTPTGSCFVISLDTLSVE